jgi:hypothetical protein
LRSSDLRYEDEAAAVFSEAERFADATGQSAIKVFLFAVYGAVRMMSDNLGEGHRLNLQAFQLAEDIGDPGLRAGARVPLAWSFYMLGHAGQAAAMAEEMIALIGEDPSMARGMVVTSPYAWCRMAGPFFAAHCGGLDKELPAIEQATELLGKEGDPEIQSHGHRNWAVIADLAGADPDAAAEHARLALEWAEEAGGAWSRIFNREAVAISHAQRGQLRRAIDVVNEGLAIARDRRIGLYNMPLLLATRARAQIGLGDIPGARTSATEAIDLAVRCGARHYEVRGRLQLARALLADLGPGDEQRVRAELDQALATVEALGIRVFTPYVHLERAQLARLLGDGAGYDEELRTAHRLFLDVGAYGRAGEITAAVGGAQIGP